MHSCLTEPETCRDTVRSYMLTRTEDISDYSKSSDSGVKAFIPYSVEHKIMLENDCATLQVVKLLSSRETYLPVLPEWLSKTITLGLGSRYYYYFPLVHETCTVWLGIIETTYHIDEL